MKNLCGSKLILYLWLFWQTNVIPLILLYLQNKQNLICFLWVVSSNGFSFLHNCVTTARGHFGDIRGKVSKCKTGSRDLASDCLWPTFAYFWLWHPTIDMRTKFEVSTYSLSWDVRGSTIMHKGKIFPNSLPSMQGIRIPVQDSVLGPQDCLLQTESKSVRPFLLSDVELSRATDRQTGWQNRDHL